MTCRRVFRALVLVPAGLLAAALPLAAQRAPTIGATGLPADVLAVACAPVVSPEPAAPTALRVTGGQDTHDRITYGPGDLITINQGADTGIEPGQQYFVRRLRSSTHAANGNARTTTVHTAGWIRVYAVDDQMSLATVTHACDTIEVGDHLERFVLPEVPRPLAERPRAERDNYGRVLVGADDRRTFAVGDYVVVSRGSDHGVTPGSHLVIYRDKRQAQNFLYELAEAVAIVVQPETSTVRITLSRDGIVEGDYVALRR